VIPILLLLVGIILQSPPRFEVASVKPVAFGPTRIEMPPTGRVNFTNASVKTLVRTAYRLENYQIIGGPDWLDVDRFDVQARPAEDYQPPKLAPCIGADCPLTPVQLMMQGLLADRFQLKMHREMREMPVYELTIGKNGFKLKEVPEPAPREPGAPFPPPPPPPPPGTPPPTTAGALPTAPPGVMMGFPFGFSASAVAFAVLPSYLSQILGRSVIDRTGIKGIYDFKLAFSRDGLPNNFPGPPPPAGAPAPLIASDPAPSIFTALQEEMGLKLDSAKGMTEVLVIDSVQKPTEN